MKSPQEHNRVRSPGGCGMLNPSPVNHSDTSHSRCPGACACRRVWIRAACESISLQESL